MLSKIAKKANVSLSTVSRILNKSHNSYGPTKEAVIQAAKECHYYENAFKNCHFLSSIAIFISKERLREHKISDIYPEQTNTHSEFYNQILAGVTERLEELLLDGQIFYCQRDSFLDTMRDYFIHNKKMDAAIFIGVEEAELSHCAPLLSNDTLKKPFLFINSQFDSYQYNNITPDNFSIGRQAVEFLYEKGHRNILHITMNHRLTMQRRTEGFRHFCEQNIKDFSVSKNLLYIPEDTYEAVGTCLQTYLKDHPLPSAIFASTDIIAVKIIQYLHKKNIHIPSKVSLISVDNQYFCELVSPQLTSIAIPGRRLGMEAVNILCFQSVFCPPHGTRITLPGSLVVRDSVASYG